MDELRIKTKFMKSMVSKLIERSIRKKTGYQIKIQLNDVDVTFDDDVAHIRVNAESDIDVYEFKKILRNIGLDD